MAKDILKKEKKYPNPKQFLIGEAGMPEGNYGQPRSYVIHDGNGTGTVIIPTADCFRNSDLGEYLNHPSKLVLFRNHPEWRKGTYLQQIDHIGLVEENGYRLRTFPIARDLGNMKIYGFASELTDRKLVREGGSYYAAPVHVISPAAMDAMVREFANWLKTAHPSLSEITCDRYADELRLSRGIYDHLKSILQKESIYEIRTVADLDAWTPELLKRIKQITETSNPILGTVIGKDYYREFLQSRSGGGSADPSDSEPEARHILSDIESVETDQTIPDETTRERLVDARLGQGKFRDALIQRYGGMCPITGIRAQAALIASHIKPWRDCDNNERLDSKNGILLAAHVDKLFDQGYISFTISGKIMLSAHLTDEEYEKFGIQRGMKIAISDGMLSAMLPYLKHHRDNIFKDDKK